MDKSQIANRLLTPGETAERLGTTPGTLAVWRATRRYALPYIKVGRAVRYRECDVESWLASRTVRPPKED